MSDTEDENSFLGPDVELDALFTRTIQKDNEKSSIQARLQMLFGYRGKAVQVDVIHQLMYELNDVIFVAKTGFGKSLIFQAAPLMRDGVPQTCLIIMPLRAIQEQQHSTLSSIQGANPFVLNGDNNDNHTRRDIARGRYTHSTYHIPYA
jgi:superfamily II DNA helicase RecQ